MYFDNISDLNPVEGYIDKFLDNLLELHEKRDYIGIKNKLKINSIKEVEHENAPEYVAIRTNNHIKKLIGVIRQIISGNMFTLWIEDVLRLWINKLNKVSLEETELLCQKCNFKNHYESSKILNFKIDIHLWNTFIIKCRRMNLTTNEGFRFALLYYVLDNELIL